MTHHFDDNTQLAKFKMKCESEPGTSKIVKTSTGKKGSLVKNLGSDLGNDSHINNVILINFKN